MKSLSTIVEENSIESRRNLRSIIEKQSLTVNENFLESFGAIKTNLDNLTVSATSMSESVKEIINKIERNKEANQRLMNEARKVECEKFDLDAKTHALNNFIRDYQLTSQQLNVLNSNDVNLQFFAALKRAKEIHARSKELIMLSKNQQTAIEIMDQMATLIETSFEKLYRWTSNALIRWIKSDANDKGSSLDNRSLQEKGPSLDNKSITDRGSFPDSNLMTELIIRSFGYLQEKPLLLQYCLDEHVTVRRSLVVRRFIDALTRGTSPQRKPIDYFSYDPMRYFGDILAWIHQAIATEKEVLIAMMKLIPDDNQNVEKFKLIKRSLSLITEGLSRPAQTRLEGVLISKQSSAVSHSSTHAHSRQVSNDRSAVHSAHAHGPVILYKLKSLIQFYKKTISDQLEASSQLVYTLNELLLMSHKMLINSLNYFTSNQLSGKKLDSEEERPNDLSPTPSFVSSVNLMQSLINCWIGSPVKDENKKDLNEIISVIMTPLMKKCRILASKLSPVDSSVFMINCLSMIISLEKALSIEAPSSEKPSSEILSSEAPSSGMLSSETPSYEGPSLHETFKSIKKQMDEYLEIVINEQALSFVVSTNLSNIYNAILTADEAPSVKVSTMIGCDSASLINASKKLDEFISSPIKLMSSQVKCIIDGDTRSKAFKESLILFTSIYSKIYDDIANHPNRHGYVDSLSVLLPRSPMQVISLLL